MMQSKETDSDIKTVEQRLYNNYDYKLKDIMKRRTPQMTNGRIPVQKWKIC